MQQQPAARRLYGSDEPRPPPEWLRAGALTLELQQGRLRRIACGGYEIWHGLALVLRDADWGTPEPQIERVELQRAEASFSARVEGRFEVSLDASLVEVNFTLRIAGDADGRIRFAAEAVAAAELPINRLGLCLLHPLSVCGAAVDVLHIDGRRSRSSFPTLIPPWPPFTLVRALRHEWAPGRWALAELHGDLFETEDQRNNADASFKTYSRSNLAPRPYPLRAGQPVRQQALLRLEGAALPVPLPAAPALQLRLGTAAAAPLPPVGIEIGPADAAADSAAALQGALRELRPAHLHLCWRPTLAVDWAGVAALMAAAGAPLRLDLQLPGNGDAPALLQALRDQLTQAGIEPGSLAVFPSTQAHVAAARQRFPGVPVGGGTPHFFVQLSRLDELGAVDFASFTTSAIVHGVDDDDAMRGLAALDGMVRTWRARHPGQALRVGPSTIAARTSPLGAQPAGDGSRRVALAAADPRSRAQFGAAWMLGYVITLADAGVQAVSLSALSGPAGVLALAGGKAEPHPAFHLLALQRGGRRLLLAANLGAEPLVLRLDPALHGASLQRLDADSDAPGWRAAGRVDALSVVLPPYGLLRIEWPPIA